MKAIVYDKYGPPNMLKLKEIDKPIPGNNEVLIKVHAATVNRTDCARLRARPFIMRFITGMFKPKNPIPGTDFAGKVEAIGKNVTLFKVGDKVFGFDDNGLSSHAQYMAISEKNALGKIPDNITYEQAAASIEGAHYAYNFINKFNFEKRQKVLINGATGAIGSAALQLLKYFGASVTAVCEGKNKSLVKSVGADKVIDYTKEDFTRCNEYFNFVFDTVGKSSFGKCKRILKSNGVYVSSELGYMSQNLFLALLTPLLAGKKVVFPFPTNRLASIHLIKSLLDKGKFIPIIDRKYPLEEIVEAFKYVEKGYKKGNVIITIDT